MLLREAFLVQNGYDILKALGLERLKSESLRKHLIAYYDVFTVLMKQAMDYDHHEFQDVLLPYLRKHFKDWEKDKFGIPNDYEQLQKDDYFLSMLKLSNVNIQGTIDEFNYGLLEIRSIPPMIDQYLEDY